MRLQDAEMLLGKTLVPIAVIFSVKLESESAGTGHFLQESQLLGRNEACPWSHSEFLGICSTSPTHGCCASSVHCFEHVLMSSEGAGQR